MTNYIGIAVSFLFVFTVIGMATFLQKQGFLSEEGSRKFIHIGVANWWLLAMAFFTSRLYACIAPACFVVINYLSYRKNIFSAMEREHGRKDIGTVYYAVSLLILAWITFAKGNTPIIGAAGILVMGYGDGLAAVIGTRFGRHVYYVGNSRKTVEGSLTMFLASFLVLIAVSGGAGQPLGLLASLGLALLATLVEAISPFGLDNLTVPLITSLTYAILW